MKKAPILACLLAFLGGSVAAQTPVRILNAGFTDGANPNATDWARVDGGGTNGSPSCYAEEVPGSSWGRSMQLKSDGGNYIQQALLETEAGAAVDASSFGRWSISFQRGYRRDAVRNGDHTLRVSLWNTTTDSELAGSDITIPDPGTTGANSLAPATVALAYDETDSALAGAGLALRITSTSADLGGNSWQRTAMVDDFSVIAGVIDPGIAVDPVPVFASNGAAGSFSLTFRNSGESLDLNLSDVSVTGTDAAFFSVTDFPASVAPGASGNITLGFAPQGGGTYSAEVVIQSNAAATPTVSIPLSVEVTDPVLSLGAEQVDFGTLPENPGSQTTPLTLTNDGGATDLIIFDVQLMGLGNGFTVDSFPPSIAPGESADLVIGFDPGGDGGHFGDLLRIETNAAVEPVRLVPVKALVGFTPATKPLAIVNRGFDAGAWNSNAGTSPAGWVSSLAPLSTGGNYGQGAPDTPNLASIAAHFQAAGGYYEQSLTANNAGLDASAAGIVTVSLDAGYRNDAVTLGDILLRVALWDEANGVEIAGRDIMLADEGVKAGTEANQLQAVELRMSYDTAAFSNEGLALRITQLEPRLGTNPWQATAIFDNVSVAVEGTWQPPANPFAAWAAAKGLDGTPGKENGPADDPDRDGRSNFDEFAFAGEPLAGASAGLVAVVAADTDADTAAELILTLAVRSGAAFTGNPSPAAVKDGVAYAIQGSSDLADFAEAVEGPLATPVVPPHFPATPPSGYEYLSFRLAGSSGLPGKGFLRASAGEE